MVIIWLYSFVKFLRCQEEKKVRGLFLEHLHANLLMTVFDSFLKVDEVKIHLIPLTAGDSVTSCNIKLF